jgi:hypothetical protein
VKPLTRGLLHPDPRSVCPLSSAEFVEPPPPREKNPGYATVLRNTLVKEAEVLLDIRQGVLEG